MTRLTTVVGMLPLALAFGEGSELLEPLAVTIVAGASFVVDSCPLNPPLTV